MTQETRKYFPGRLMQFFKYDHLPAHLQEVSKPFGDLASHLDQTLPSNEEKTTAIRKLLEAKDCAVRALLFKDPGNAPEFLPGKEI
jgi:hypothetical protein